MTWVIAYDVTSNRNRTRVSKRLTTYGLRLQKSVFLVEASRRQVRELVEELSEVVDRETDSVCAWPLSENWQAQQQVFPSEAAPLQEVFVVA